MERRSKEREIARVYKAAVDQHVQQETGQKKVP